MHWRLAVKVLSTEIAVFLGNGRRQAVVTMD